MGMVVPKVRKHLCADALLRSVQNVFCQLPDHRKGDAEIPLHEGAFPFSRSPYERRRVAELKAKQG
jgi:hypothetical protein